MFGLGSASLGTILLALGLAFFLLTFFVSRLVPRIRSIPKPIVGNSKSTDLSPHDDVVLLVQSGGWISYANPAARVQLDLLDEEPNLEQLARRSRPSHVFWELCTSEGQANFSIDGRPYRGTSYIFPNGDGNTILLSLRSEQKIPLGSENIETFNRTVEILKDLNLAMTADLEFEPTLHTILQSVEQLIPTDYAEITIWDSENQVLVPYKFIGIQGLDRQLEKTSDRYLLGEGYSGQVAKLRETLLIPDVDAYSVIQPTIDRKKNPFQSYLGVPLEVNGNLIGTLAFSSREKNAFTESDVSTLKMLSGQAAIAIHNALIYQQEQRRAEELNSLANLAKAVSAVRDFKELYAQLVHGITPILDIEIAGFLIYDETQRILAAQNPFIGIPSQFVELYKVPIPIDSLAEKMWLQQKPIVTRVASEDPRLIDLGLDHSARAAGIVNTALIPLTSAGRSIGYLQAANKKDGMPFDQSDVRLLEIIAMQAAPIIENANLIKQSVGRALRAEALRRIASLSGSAATLDEIFKYSLLELARLLQADVASIFLLDENLRELRVHISSLFGIDSEQLPQITRLPVGVENTNQTVTASRTPFLTGNANIDERVLPGVAALIEPLGVTSIINVPLIIRDRGLGEIILCSREEDFFSQSDVQLTATVASQLAIALERSKLTSQTDVDLRQRVEQLSALSRISRELNTSVQLPHLLQLVNDEALRITNADSGVILLFKLNGTRPKFPKIYLQLGDPHGNELTPLERIVLERGDPLIIDDFEHLPEECPPEIWYPPKNGVISAMIVPISYLGDVTGIISLCARSQSCFDSSALERTQALAAQAAIAIGNTLRYQQKTQQNDTLKLRIEMLSNILDTTQNIRLDTPLEVSLEEIGYGILSATPFSIALIYLYDLENRNLHSCSSLGIPYDLLETLENHPIPWPEVSALMKPEYCFGRSYYITHEQNPDVPSSFRSIIELLGGNPDTISDPSQWNPNDILIIPLVKSNAEPMGLMMVSAPRDQKRPDIPTLEMLEIFAGQASLVIDNHQQIIVLGSQVNDLAEKLEQYRGTQVQLPTLIQKEKEQTEIIQALSWSSVRVNASLNIIEILNKQSDRNAVLATLGREILSQMGMDIVMIVEPGPKGPQLLHISGEIPESSNPEALLGQRNPLLLSLQGGETILVSNLQEDKTWNQSPLLLSLNAAGVICLPVTMGGGIDAALLAISKTELPSFSANDTRIFELLSHQTGIAINNLNILSETGHRLLEVNLLLDFSRQLGTLEPTRILRTLIDSSMQVAENAQAGLVTLFDQDKKALIPQAARGYANDDAIMQVVFGLGGTLLGQVFSQGNAARIDDVNFAQLYPLGSDDLLRYREATSGILPVSCLAIPIQSGETTLGVILLDNFREAAAFSEEDQALITSLAQQTALTLENARLFQAAENRANQLQALSNVASAITSSLEPDALIDSLLEKLEDVVPYETGTLWLRDKENLKIHSARGFENNNALIGLSTTTEDSLLFREMIKTNLPISVTDVRSDSRFPGIETERLSWLGVPLISKGDLVGAIALEKLEVGFYTVEHIQSATTFASQAAVALENANLYQQSLQRTMELDQRSQRLALLNRFSNQISSVLDPNYILDTTMQELIHAFPATTVSTVMWESDRPVLRAELPDRGVDLPLILPDAPIFERLKQTLGLFNTQDVTQERELAPFTNFFKERQTRALLALPLVTGDTLHGLFLLQNEQGYRYTADEIELARIITNQAAVAVQNAISFEATTRLSEELEQRVAERTAQLEQEHLREQSLLRIMRELSASLDLDQVLNQTLVILNETVGAEQSTILLIDYEENAFYYRASVGYAHSLPRGGQLSSLKLDEGLAGWVIKNRKSALVSNVNQDERWIPISNFSTSYNSVIVVPLRVGEEALGVVTLAHSEIDAFTIEDQELAQAAAMQMAVAINNAELFNLIRDQAEGLGTMLRSQQVEASRSTAILEAVADGVLVTDDQNEITLFNESAQQILDLERAEVIGKSLDEFTGLFGRAAQSWMETIHNWSQDPTSYQIGDTYAERFTLDNNRVVSIHLAPVVMGNEFLGTVSIFRDITHEVEVDRLKSEFVATVSHELRTPMTSIKGYVDILLMGAAGELTKQQTNFLDIVKTNTERLNILVNDLLDVSRIEAGKVELIIQSLDIRQLIEEIVNDLIRRSKVEHKSMAFKMDLPRSFPRVPGDEERVRQILDNLIRNAYLYTPANGQIDIKIRVWEDEIQVDVHDNGIGIKPEDHDRIFERFYRGEDPLVLESSGNGLGLSIVRQLINMHHGRIWLESQGIPGEGSIFSFTLPLKNPPRGR